MGDEKTPKVLSQEARSALLTAIRDKASTSGQSADDLRALAEAFTIVSVKGMS